MRNGQPILSGLRYWGLVYLFVDLFFVGGYGYLGSQHSLWATLIKRPHPPKSAIFPNPPTLPHIENSKRYYIYKS